MRYRDACLPERARAPRYEASTAWAAILLGSALSACGYIDYDYLPTATQSSEAETAEVTLNAGSTETDAEAAPGESPDTSVPTSGSTSPVARSLQLTPDTRAIDIALAGDPLPSAYRYALRRSITGMPATPSDGDEICAT